MFHKNDVIWTEEDEENYQRMKRRIAHLQVTKSVVTPVTLDWSPELLAGNVPAVSAQANDMYEAATMWQG